MPASAAATAPAHDRQPLTVDQTRRTMRLAVADGALFALMLGIGETCFLAEAVRIGAGPWAISLLTAVPLLCGGLGSVAMLRLLRRLPERRTWVVICALGQVLVLAALALAVAVGSDRVPLVLTLLCVYHTCGQAAGTAWSSWYGDVVPRELRGRYFAGRNRIVHLATFASVVGAGTVLHALSPTHGFALLFGLAALIRLGSAALLARADEPPFRVPAQRARPLHFLAGHRGRNAWRLILGGGAFHFGVYLAAPFFAPHMLEDCRLDYFDYMLTLGAAVAMKALSLPMWGRIVDRCGAHRAMTTALFLSAWIPLPFLFATSRTGLAAAYGFSGLAWAGFEVAAFAAILDSTTRRTRPQVFAAQALVTGSAQLGGSLAGAGLAAGGGFALAFLISFLCRLAVALLLPAWLRPLRPRQRRPALALRMAGFRAHGGPVHRPIDDDGERPRRHAATLPFAEEPAPTPLLPLAPAAIAAPPVAAGTPDETAPRR